MQDVVVFIVNDLYMIKMHHELLSNGLDHVTMFYCRISLTIDYNTK